MEEKLNKEISDICDKLCGLNYVPNIQVFSGKWIKGENEENILKSIMSNDFFIRSLKETKLNNIIIELENGISYPGDDGHYPDKKYFGSEKYKSDLKSAKTAVRSLFKDCSKIFSFYIREGHPFYPVFWEFSFLLKHGEIAYVFIGSSSD